MVLEVQSAAISPRLMVPALSIIGVKLVPLLLVYHKPPLAYATNISVGSAGLMSISTTRPDITVGPIFLNSRFLKGEDCNICSFLSRLFCISVPLVATGF